MKISRQKTKFLLMILDSLGRFFSEKALGLQGNRHDSTASQIRSSTYPKARSIIRILTDELHLLRLLGPRLALAARLLKRRVIPPLSRFGNSDTVKALEAFSRGRLTRTEGRVAGIVCALTH